MLKPDEQIVAEEFKDIPEIDKAIELIKEYKLKDYFPSKNKRLKEWEPSDNDLYEIVIAIVTLPITHDYVTYQMAVGLTEWRICVEANLDKIKIIAEIIALVNQIGLINIVRPGSGHSMYITTNYEIEQEIPLVDRHCTIYHRPQPVEDNYDPEQGSMILGGHINHHEEDICLEHINLMNQIPMELNYPFIIKYEEKPKKSAINNPQKEAQWKLYLKRAKQKYAEGLVKRSKIYLNHKYCTRGRCYTTGYFIDSQGNAFKKSAIELFNKEKVND